MATATVKRPKLQAPFPWFGGKSRVAHIVWDRFGDVRNYVEPFFGSGAVLLGRPHPPKTETINDKDGYVANFWRAVKNDPQGVAEWADNPVNENDLHARHIWLVNQKKDFVPKLEGDPDFFCAKTAGWWVWGQCSWIGSGFCSGNGPWGLDEGQLVHLGDAGQGVNRQLVHLGDAGQGVNRQLVHLGDAGQGVNRKRVHLGDAGQGVNRKRENLSDWMQSLSDRMSRVRVCCGDWGRVCTPSVTEKHGLTGIFLDPPYTAKASRASDLYSEDCLSVGHDVCKWAIENGDNPHLRIAVCGYEGEYMFPESWECVSWKAQGGMASQGSRGEVNRHRERIWFSPHCLKPETLL